MSTILEVAPEHEHELVLARRLEASPAACFRCWTEPALITQWFTPPPWKTVEAHTELRVGGATLIVMEGPDGTRMPNRGVYLEVVPGRRIVFTDAYVEAWKPGPRPPFFTGVLTFEPDGDGCRYVARARHWTEEAKTQHEAMGFQTGWGIAADQLEALARTL